MNIKNALGFFCLGLLMQTTLVVVQSFAEASGTASGESVRTIWVQFMSWVIGGIGFGNLAREGLAHLPNLLSTLVPAQVWRPAETKTESLQLPVAARAGVSS